MGQKCQIKRPKNINGNAWKCLKNPAVRILMDFVGRRWGLGVALGNNRVVV